MIQSTTEFMFGSGNVSISREYGLITRIAENGIHAKGDRRYHNQPYFVNNTRE